MNDMKQQPEALRLAAYFDGFFISEEVNALTASKTASELRRLHDLIVKADALAHSQAARIAELEANLKRATSAASDTSGLTMCADQHCPEFGTCYRAQAKAAPGQHFWALSPREDNSCRFYAPIYFTNGARALRENAQ